jgi:hypothetical protein
MDRHIFVLLIIAIVMFASVMTARYRSLGRRAAAADDPDAARLKEEVRALKERIAVLERIATDKESSLEREIERLRDR